MKTPLNVYIKSQSFKMYDPESKFQIKYVLFFFRNSYLKFFYFKLWCKCNPRKLENYSRKFKCHMPIAFVITNEKIRKIT